MGANLQRIAVLEQQVLALQKDQHNLREQVLVLQEDNLTTGNMEMVKTNQISMSNLENSMMVVNKGTQKNMLSLEEQIKLLPDPKGLILLPVRARIQYDAAYYFRWYSTNKVENCVIDCTIVDVKGNYMIVNTILPKDAKLGEKAFSLMKCQELPDGTWNLLLINESIFLVDILSMPC